MTLRRPSRSQRNGNRSLKCWLRNLATRRLRPRRSRQGSAPSWGYWRKRRSIRLDFRDCESGSKERHVAPLAFSVVRKLSFPVARFLSFCVDTGRAGKSERCRLKTEVWAHLRPRPQITASTIREQQPLPLLCPQEILDLCHTTEEVETKLGARNRSKPLPSCGRSAKKRQPLSGLGKGRA